MGGAAVAGAIKAGVPEHEVAIASTTAMIREIAKSFPFVELMDTWTWFQSGINTDGAHNPVTNKKIVSGDILSLNTFPMIFGYYTALERTLFCDHVDDASLDIWEKNVAVHRRGLDLIKPGAKCNEIAIELNDMYRQWDLLKYRSFGYGHSFGVLVALLRSRGRGRIARRHRDGAEARHGGVDGADGHVARRHAGCWWLPRA